MRRTADWWRQAEHDLLHARHALDDEDFEWACFAAHQAAEKATRALLQSEGAEACGHSLTFLVQHVPEGWAPPVALRDQLPELDRHYLAPRYPDAYPEGAPVDYYNRPAALSAVRVAEEVLAHVRRCLEVTDP